MCTCPRAGLKRALLSHFTAKSSFQGQFHAPLPWCSILENVAHCFHSIGYTLTCLFSVVSTIASTVGPSGRVGWRRRYIGCFARNGRVYRGSSITEQAPLGGFGAPPSP